MHLVKRDCPVKIKLTPCSTYYLLIDFEINGEKHSFFPSAAVSYHFLDFMAAVYQLYTENDGLDCHNDAFLPNRLYGKSRRKINTQKTDPQLNEEEISVETSIDWDEEGPTATITLYRKAQNGDLAPIPNDPDPIQITICYDMFPDKSGEFTYVVDGKDLCYAVAKAGMDVIKTYGFHGYFFTSGLDNGIDNWIDINQLLFFKAYALGVMEVRDFSEVSTGKNNTVLATDFEKELELLLFDM